MGDHAIGGIGNRAGGAPDSWIPTSLRPAWRDLFKLARLTGDRFSGTTLRIAAPAKWALSWLFVLPLVIGHMEHRVVARDGARAVLTVEPMAPRSLRGLPGALLAAACWAAVMIGTLSVAATVVVDLASLTGSTRATNDAMHVSMAVIALPFAVGMFMITPRVLRLRRGARSAFQRHCDKAGGTWWRVTNLAGRRDDVTETWLHDELLPLVDAQGVGLLANAAHPKLEDYYRRLGFVGLDDARSNLMYRPSATPSR